MLLHYWGLCTWAGPGAKSKTGGGNGICCQCGGLAGAILTHAKQCARNLRVPEGWGKVWELLLQV
jgi:hypothetical protein